MIAPAVRRAFPLTLSTFLVFGMTACGESDAESPAEENDEATEAQEESDDDQVGEEAQDTEADSAEDEGDDDPESDAEEETQQSDEGVIATGVDRDMSVQGARQPDGEVITPGGTVTVTGHATADTLPGNALGQDSSDPADDDGETEYEPASGEVFYVLDLATEFDGPEPVDVAVDVDGQRTGLSDLQVEDRLVVSVPEDGEGHLIVTSDGHEQTVDLHTGDRAEPGVAATYYRDATQQDVTHTFASDGAAITIDEELTVTLDPDVVLESARITPHFDQEDNAQGWASDGSMWLVMDWRYDFSTAESGFSFESASFDWTAEAAGETSSVTEQDSGFGNEWTTAVEVPMEAESVTVTPEATVGLSSWGNSATGTMTFDGFTVEFPADSGEQDD